MLAILIFWAVILVAISEINRKTLEEVEEIKGKICKVVCRLEVGFKEPAKHCITFKNVKNNKRNSKCLAKNELIEGQKSS